MDTIWKDMPMPDDELAANQTTSDITVPDHVWRKIGEKHMRNGWEPWDDGLVEGDEAAALRAMWPRGCVNEKDRQTVLTVSRRVCEQAHEALRAPLVMTYFYGHRETSSIPSQGQARR